MSVLLVGCFADPVGSDLTPGRVANAGGLTPLVWLGRDDVDGQGMRCIIPSDSLL